MNIANAVRGASCVTGDRLEWQWPASVPLPNSPHVIDSPD